MTRLIEQKHIQAYYEAYSEFLTAIYDSAKGPDRVVINRKSLAGHSVFIKQLKAMPTSKYTLAMEINLKRRLTKLDHKLNGYLENKGNGIANKLPAKYRHVVNRLQNQQNVLLRKLSAIDITTAHFTLKRVSELL